MSKSEIRNDPYAIDIDQELRLPPDGKPLPLIKIKGGADNVPDRHPLHWRLTDAARRWRELLRDYSSNFQIFCEVDNVVHCVLTESESLAIEDVPPLELERLNDCMERFHRKETDKERAAWAWHFFRLHAQLGQNQYPRKVSWEIPDAQFTSDDIHPKFEMALAWQLDARSPNRRNRGLHPDKFLHLEGSRTLGRELQELLDTSTVPQSVAGALNELLHRVDLFDFSQFFRPHRDTLPHLQVTRRLVNIIHSLADNDALTGSAPNVEWLLRIKRLWIEGLLHNPEPATYEMDRFFPSKKSGRKREGFMEVWEPLAKIPIAPYFDPVTKDTWCPLYLEPSSRLLGMVRLVGFDASTRSDDLQQLGNAIQQLIVPMIRATRCAFEPVYRMKACRSEGQILEVVNYLANEFIGSNDSCIRFVYKGKNRPGCIEGANSYLRCAHANCQYQHKDFEPGLGVEEGIGTVWDILNASASDNPSQRDAEIINDLFEDERHQQACRSFIEDEVTFYDQAAVQVLLEHKSEKGVAVLQRLNKAAFSEGEVSLFQSILKIAEMRLDELEAESARMHDVLTEESPLDWLGYRQIFIRMGKRRGGMHELLTELLSNHGGAIGHDLHTVALVSVEPKVSSGNMITVKSRFFESESPSLIQSTDFCRMVVRETGNHDVLRAFWTWSVASGGTEFWRDIFHNSRIAEMYSKVTSAHNSQLMTWAPLDVHGNLYLWTEFTLSPECTPETVLNLDDWRALEMAMSDLNRLVQSERRNALVENALRGQVAVPLRHNVMSLFSDIDYELLALADRARSKGLIEELGELGYYELLTVINAAKDRVINFGSMVHEAHPKEQDAVDVLNAIVTLIERSLVSAHGIVNVEDIKRSTRILVDLQQFQVAVSELVNNSRREFKHIKDRPQIWLWAEIFDDEFHLHYEDNGRGIPPDRRASVFEWTDRDDQSAGTGLGLFIVQSILEKIEGRIVVAPPNRGSGAHFNIRIPIK